MSLIMIMEYPSMNFMVVRLGTTFERQQSTRLLLTHSGFQSKGDIHHYHYENNL